jgi:hypothetical protein
MHGPPRRLPRGVAERQACAAARRRLVHLHIQRYCITLIKELQCRYQQSGVHTWSIPLCAPLYLTT